MPPIHVPIVSSNMDTVTEGLMATTMALHGGLGVIHRFIPSEQQAAEVLKVKETMRVIEEDPPLLPETATIADALNLLKKRPRGYIIVYHGETFSGPFVGIATTKDFLAEKPDAPITRIMTLRENVITVPQGTELADAVTEMKTRRIEKIPMVDAAGNLRGVYTLKDDELFRKYPLASLDLKGKLMVGAAIGVRNGDIQRAHILVDAGVDVLVLDIAHGHLIYTKEMLHRLKNEEGIKIPIIAGNVATRKGTLYIRDSDADGVKVGVGPGFVCETRNVAGVGVPQITAIREARRALEEEDDPIPIMADGGIRKAGDVSKAIVAGADLVMIGSLFAGTDESPGETVFVDGKLQVMVRGMASASAFEKRQQLGDATRNAGQYVPEGRTTFTPYRGPVAKVLYELMGGLRSGMSYVGAHTIEEMQKQGQLRQVTHAGANEQRRPLG